MARRKKTYMSDDSDSDGSDAGGSEGGYNSQEDGDSRAERALFEYNGSKRRKMGGGLGKEAAWGGIFMEDEEENRAGGRGIGSKGGGRGGKSGSRSDFTKAPSFISGGATGAGPSKAQFEREDVQDEEDDDDEEDESEDSDDSTPARSPRIRDEEDEDQAPGVRANIGLGGLGFRPGGPGSANTPDVEDDNEAGPSRGIGSVTRGKEPKKSGGGRGAIGSARFKKKDPAEAAEVEETTASTPEPERERSTFKGRQQADAPPSFTKPVELSAQEHAHFRSINNTFGAKILQNFGWNAGEGLGKDKSGRAVPIMPGKHMKGKGIMSGVRTEDSKREARRKGEIVSDSEDEKENLKSRRKPQGGKGKPQAQEQSWRRQKKVKVKVEHKTYEQLLAEAGDSTTSGMGLVIDARGGDMREVESLSALDLSGWTPTGDNAQLPELRHNLRLVVDVSKGDVEALVREGRSVNEKKRWTVREEQIARAKMDEGEKQTARLEKIQAHIAEITSLATSQAAQVSPSLTPLASSFEALLTGYKEEYNTLDLDDAVVGAIGMVMRRAFGDWDPFDVSSDVLLSTLKPWRHAFRLPSSETEVNRDQGRGMTAWESLLWALWLPKVRSTINNDWSPSAPQAAVHLLESWEPLLPSFIRDNILDQLILPKVKQAMEEWDGRPSKSGKTRSLSGIVFPWLPLLGHRMEDILDGAKRRIRHVMRRWIVRDGVPEELSRWRKDIFTSKEWDELMLRTVVPKLGICLRDDFTINPRKQDMVPLEEWVMPWHSLLRSSVFSQLLEVNFFPKWLDILYIWLVQPNFKADEVANWFTWWKSRFPDQVLAMSGVSHGFTSGLNLMQEAMHLGADAPTKLRKPIYEPPKTHSSSKTKEVKPVRKAEVPTGDITFRTLVEEVVAQNDLVFFPLGRSHATTGKPLFKVAKSVDGRGGVSVYVGEDAVFALAEDGTYKAVSLEDLVKRAAQ